MPYLLNKKLAFLTPYDPIEGNYKIRLDANESYINLNDTLSCELSEIISKVALNRYPDPYAKDTVKAFSQYYNVPEEFVTAGNGSDELISVITSCFLEKDDSILTLSPDFSMYAFYGSLYELNVETLQKNSDLCIDVDEVITFCNNNKIKALIFSNPCNPTSLGLEQKEVIRLIENVNCLVILDEAYMDFWSESLLEFVSEYDNLIILKTCSKAIGLAAVRLGFAVAGKTVTNALKAAKSPYNTDSISQAIGAFILSQKDLLDKNRALLISQRGDLYSDILALSEKYGNILEKVYNSATNFIFVKTKYYNEIFEQLLKNSIAVRKFNGYLRITAGSKSENTELIYVLKTILKNM